MAGIQVPIAGATITGTQGGTNFSVTGPSSGGSGGFLADNADAIGGLVGGLFGLAGQKKQQKELGQTQQFLQDQVGFNPQGFSGTGTNLQFQGGQGVASEGAQQQILTQLLQGGAGGFLQGGSFNDPNFQQAFNQNDIAGAFGGAQQGLQQQLGQNAFGGLGGLFQQFQGLGQQAAGQFAQGPQDLTGGLQNQLFGQSQGFLQGAQGGALAAQQQSLSASRALAQPFEQRATLSDENRRFAQGRLGTTGGSQQGADLAFSQALADNARIGQAQQIGNQTFQQNIQAGLGTQAAGAGLLGQNLGQFNQFGQFASQFGQGQQNAELGGFGQLLQSLQQNQGAGNKRLENALGLFGIGDSSSQSNFQTGLQGQNTLTGRDQLLQELFLGSQNAEANRIGAAGQSSQAISGTGQAKAAGSGGFGSTLGKIAKIGISSLFSDKRLKKNLKKVGTVAEFDLYTWEWNAIAKKLGIDAPTIGVIAQEVQKTRPELVSESEGYLQVDYAGIL